MQFGVIYLKTQDGKHCAGNVICVIVNLIRNVLSSDKCMSESKSSTSSVKSQSVMFSP